MRSLIILLTAFVFGLCYFNYGLLAEEKLHEKEIWKFKAPSEQSKDVEKSEPAVEEPKEAPKTEEAKPVEEKEVSEEEDTEKLDEKKIWEFEAPSKDIKEEKPLEEKRKEEVKPALEKKVETKEVPVQPAVSTAKKGIKGFVISIDENSIVIVDDKNQNHSFKITKATKFIDANKGSGLVKASEIEVNERVRVDCKENEPENAYQVVQLITSRIKK
ncbi:MAG: hypothetical protein AB1765_13450 [Candidatus Hydrogenedentota bacterium]